MSLGAILDRIPFGRLVTLLLPTLLVPTADSAAQPDWQRTVEVIAPIEEGVITRALTDSVVAAAKAGELPIQRSPESDTTTLSPVQEALSGEGLALNSATHVFITYRYQLRKSNLRREILDLYFIYRPSEGEDIPILYVDLTKDNLYHNLLVEKGTPSPINEVVSTPFAEQIGFHKLRDDVTVTRVGGQIIRDENQSSAVKERILARVRTLTYRYN